MDQPMKEMMEEDGLMDEPSEEADEEADNDWHILWCRRRSRLEGREYANVSSWRVS